MKKFIRYLHNVLVGADQEVNIVAGGVPDETISSRVQRDAQKGKWLGVGLTKFLRLFQKNHGIKAEQHDLQRAETVETLEEDALK